MNKLPPFSQRYPFYFLCVVILFLSSCSESPENFFDITILNTNVINDFASPNLAHSIEAEAKEFPDIPSSKKKGDEAATMVNYKILYVEQSLDKVKKLSASGDEEKELQELSTRLYELVIPVYKNEYMAFAKLCDAKGSQSSKDALIEEINKKYGASFEQNFNLLNEKGKAFAAKHNIQVTWGK